MDFNQLEKFIVKAKKNCYVGDGKKIDSSRHGSHDIEFKEDKWHYVDSYFGGTDFLGQEVVWFNFEPVWAMNYYGRIIKDELLNSDTSGTIIKKSLSALYNENRFLGGFDYEYDGFHYNDKSKGDFKSFTGTEIILKDDICLYQLDYHGGIIRK